MKKSKEKVSKIEEKIEADKLERESYFDTDAETQSEDHTEWEQETTSRPTFHDFKDNSTVVGQYIGETSLTYGDGEIVEDSECYEFENLDGEKFLLNKWSSLKNAIEKKKSVGRWFKIIYQGKVDIKGGKSFTKLKIYSSNGKPTIF